MTRPPRDWLSANQRCLGAAIGVARALLRQHANGRRDPEVAKARRRLENARRAMPATSSFDLLGTLFGLSEFERMILAACAGMELEAGFAAECGAAQGDPTRSYPTFGLALAAFPGAHWSALAPSAPLRSWHLVELSPGAGITQSQLGIDERILHHLAGVAHLDERLQSVVTVIEPNAVLVPSHDEIAGRLAGEWSRRGLRPIVKLCGPDARAKRDVAAAACRVLGWDLAAVRAQLLPTAAAELHLLGRLIEREWALASLAIYIDCESQESDDPAAARAAIQLIERTSAPVAVALGETRFEVHRPSVTLDVERPTPTEQASAWRHTLDAGGVSPDGAAERLASQFNLTASSLTAACGRALTLASDLGSAQLPQLLWECCRVEAQPQLESLAQHVEASATWDDLVLPEPQRMVLRQIASQLRQRNTVHLDWGFAAKSPRGLGLSALFVGASGTGKTMAAEVLAREVDLDLYRIDLSQVVSKYIGETEKNLRRVFDGAEEGGGILLFDEADALFGKRSEVRDSHDRYANIEISYLLQRMEEYRGLAILTTNLKSEMDAAFLRRIKFVVQFAFPDAAQRSEIWKRVFPAATPMDELDIEKLGRLNVAGGNIRNIALNAAFLAADAGQAVGMEEILAAARTEYMKLERPLTAAEVGEWV